MEALYFRICVFLGLLAGAVIVALPLRRQFADFHEFVRRTPKWQRAFLALLAAVFIAYGSTKTNQVENGEAVSRPLLMGMAPPFTSGQETASPLAVTPAEIARGWQLVGVDTNAAVDYAMPEGAVLASNWWVRGAFDDVTKTGLDGWRFPFGTNAYSSLWAFSWGKARFRFDDTNEITVVASPMSAVPYRSRLWTLETNNAFLVTWENFALNRDTNTPVNAQLELHRNGDFVTRSNAVETAYRRVCPEDWDDDGIPNDDDANSYFRDGDFFGPRQTLPDEANEGAYCWVEIAADVNAHVVFTGDGESDLPDPDFMLRAGETNRVTLLIGKTYTVESTQPLTVTDRSDGAIGVGGNGSCRLTIVWPVSVYAMEGNGASFMMRVVPNSIGGEFKWTDDCCPITGSGRVFSWGCNGLCLCTGCTAQGALVYEGYSIPVTGGHCGCSYGPRPAETEPDDDQMVAGVSASFSPEAVIFEDAYTNMPGEVVGRRSTEAVLSCAVHGGFRGGTATFSFAGEARLAWIRGAMVPQTSVTIPPGEKLEFAAAYEGLRPSAEAEDITYTVTFTENDTTNGPTVVTAKLTSVKVEIVRKDEAPIEVCPCRHVFGVQEGADVHHYPSSVDLSLSFNSADAVVDVDNEWFYCPWTGGEYELSVNALGVGYASSIRVFEPLVVCRNAEWDRVRGTVGCSGQVCMNLFLYVEPSYVSFDGIFMEEIPDTSICPHDGYFSDPDENKTGAMSHSESARAGEWIQVHGDEWAADRVARNTVYPQPWTSGWKEWQIPVGWGDFRHTLRGQIHPNPTTQRFTIAPDGTATIRKYNHTIERRVNNDVYLDGVLQQ